MSDEQTAGERLMALFETAVDRDYTNLSARVRALSESDLGLLLMAAKHVHIEAVRERTERLANRFLGDGQ